jgi:hypothetical protein
MVSSEAPLAEITKSGFSDARLSKQIDSFSKTNGRYPHLKKVDFRKSRRDESASKSTILDWLRSTIRVNF